MTSFAISDMKVLRGSGGVEASVNALQASIVEIGSRRLKKVVKRVNYESSAVDEAFDVPGRMFPGCTRLRARRGRGEIRKMRHRVGGNAWDPWEI
eukprot:g13526.t1